ncbi:hypothetical protein LR48_Vigan09g184500 [Vigna angularis]|uniref:Uncharacterized protein n=1 Tax=Phaseolus angularis TaxID=3914 RepID=A0A0L9VDP8_PHAAN|nr:hypothetical protein LR48_Vigan09g184500 [Vigna angularis]
MDNRPGRFRYNRSGVPPSGRLRRTRSGVPYLVCPTGARKHNIVDRAIAGGRQQLNAHKCVVNEVNPSALIPSAEEAREGRPSGREGRPSGGEGLFPDGGSRSFPLSHSAKTLIKRV